jgi:uncharacterized membrane protein
MSTATRAEQVTSAPPDTGVTLPTASRSRIDSIDLVRGIVIVPMALDHTKDYIGTSRFDPLDADATNLSAYEPARFGHLGCVSYQASRFRAGGGS